MLRVPGTPVPTKRLRVSERQSLSRSSSVALVRVGSRAYLVGATDASVSLLADVSETVAEADATDAERQHASTGTNQDTAINHADINDTGSEHQGTGASAGAGPLHSARMDLVGAILQRMTRRA
jgi:flagellar biogenesis protein FliO